MNATVYRQPILNSEFAVEGFELLTRQEATDTTAEIFSGEDSDVCRVLTNAFCGFTEEELLKGGAAYVGISNNLIEEGFVSLYSTDRFIVEVQPNLFLDEELAAILSALRRKGYRLALKSYSQTVEISRNFKYLNLFDVVRIDFRKHHRLNIRQYLKMLRKYRMRLLAENVDTPDELAFARELGFDLYQGAVFGPPAVLSRKASLREVPYGRLFNHLLTGRVNRDLCARIIMDDPAMTHMFLRKVFNSMYNRREVGKEVERGLFHIGDDKLRHWAAVLLLDQACEDGREELVPSIYRRGLLMEGMASAANIGVPPGKAFMFGVASALDRIISESAEELSAQLSLGEGMRAAFLTRADNIYTSLIEAAEAFEAEPEKEGKPPVLPPAFSGLSRKSLSDLYWSCQVNTEYITLSLKYTVPETYKGNILH